MELRRRVVDFVEEGHSHREAARHFRVSIKFVNDMVRLKRETGTLEARPQGRRGHGKLAGAKEWVRERMAGKPDTTLDELTVALREECSVEAHRSSVGRLLQRLHLSHKKKDLRASERERPDVAEERSFWTTFRRPFMRNNIERLVFIDETSLKTNMVKASGWAPVGERLIDHAPAGHWNTQTFIMALRHDGVHAPGITDGSMDMGTFDLYVERMLAPALRRGDIVILDNLAAHRSARAAEILESVGARFSFLPRYSPDLNPIEMAFSKLKALMRKIAARTYDDLWRAVGEVFGLFTPQECGNYLAAAGYETN